MKNEIQLDLATMALKGKRYEEAEKLYMQIATEQNSTEAWVGMGICKLYQLAEGRTMDEVVFCMNRAKKMSPEITDEVDCQLMVNTLIVLRAYVSVVEHSYKEMKKEKNAAIFGAVLTGVSIVSGLSSKSTFGTVASLAGTGAGVGVAVDSLNKMTKYEDLIKSVLKLCDDAYSSVTSNITNKNEVYLEFENNVQQIINLLQNIGNSPNYLSTNDATIAPEGSHDWLTTLLLCLFFGFLGGHSFYTKKVGIGIVQLLTFGGFGIWVLIDLIYIITGKFKDGNGYPLFKK